MKIISKSNDHLTVSFKDLVANGFVLENFLIENDLVLRKRNGYKKLLDLSVAPNSVYISTSSPGNSVHIVLENYVSSLDLENLYEYLPYQTQKPITRGNSAVIRFNDDTVIFDGGCVCRKTNIGTQAVSGYVPLCANMWEFGKKGEIFERLNLLSNHFRATYHFSGEESVLILPYDVDTIDCIRYNGITVGEDEYELSADGSKVTCHFLDEDGVVTVYASFGEGFVSDSCLARCRSASCSGEENAAVYVFGSSQEGNEVKVYVSSTDHGTPDTFANSLYNVNSSLCFFEGDEFRVSSGKEIRAVFPVYDKALIFTEDECYLKENGARPTLLVSGAGAVCNNSVAFRGNEIVFAGRNGIFRLTLAEKKENVKFERLASPADFPESFLSEACICHETISDVLYVYNKYRSLGAFAYFFETKALSHLTNFLPHVMFCFGAKTYFTTDNKLFVFSEDSCCDSPDGEAQIPVEATFTSNFFDFGEPFLTKKCVSVALSTISQAPSLEFIIELDNGKKVKYKLEKSGGKLPTVFVRKLPPHRFVNALVSITDMSPNGCRIPCLELTSRVCDRNAR